MRINSIPPKELLYQYVYVKDKPISPVQPPAVTDKVELTDEAKTFSAALRAARDAMDVRSPAETNRIETVRQQIKDQTYSVPGSLVAGKMLGK